MIEILEELKNRNIKRVFIQIADGLKTKILEIINDLEKNGIETVLCMENTYGACDVREYEARLLNCDAILHIGHTNFGVKTEIPVIYYAYFIDFEKNYIEKIIEKNFDKIKNFSSFCLVSNVNYHKVLLKVKDILTNLGKKVFIGKTLEFEGQILGCNVSAALSEEKKIDCFIVISSGKFYSLGLTLKTKKPVFLMDLDSQKIISLENIRKKYEKIIAWNKSFIKDAKKIGILVSWKRGQMFGDPFKIKKLLEEKGKKCYILAFDEISYEKIEGLKLDLLVNCACPRIFPDDYEKFKIPIVNYFDVIY